MITNVPFTGSRNVGTRDQTTAIAAQWKQHIPEIYVWDAANLSCMLDADEDVRTAYLDDILPGDVLKAIYTKINFRNDRKKSAFNAYLTYVIECEKSARAQEAGDAQDLPLSEVFIDFTLELAKISQKSDFGDEFSKVTWDIMTSIDSDATFSPTNWSRVRASNALFIIESDFVLLLGGPGLGKSTLIQFLSLYQAARLIKPDLAQSLTQRLKLPQSISPENLDAYVCLRFPFRIELRRYAKWMSERNVNNTDGHLSHYIVEVLINPNVDANLENDDIFGLAATDPILLVLDGLDEVPNRDTRQKIIENLKIFVNRIQAEKGNLQVILSSRPNGYSGEFDEFKPLIWEVNELEKADFDEYCEQWLKQRIPSLEERREAKEKIEVGMLSESVQRLAKSLLQATVILTIVKSKVQIPHQKHSLYKKYVDVIFEREKEKTPIIRKWENELLQLHQRVGFELHQKMEQSKIETLNRDEEFRKYIYDVLEDCSTGSRTLGEIVQEIVDIATDRLCLLVGKGENQTEIDFVVQQYREYFAASYLTNHPDAEPEKVFSMLINRGAYWSYVLQFYFAQATSNQQLRWLNDIESIDETIERTKACRAIMNTLPEINDSLKLKHFEQALKIIFYTETRWTWMVENSVIDVLKNTRSGSALQVIRKWLDNLSIGDQQTLEAELWLLGEIFSLEQKEEQLTLFENKVQELLQNENTRDNALISALENDLKIDLSTSNILEIKPTLSKFYYESILHINKKPESLNNFIQSQNITKLCELMFCFPLWEFTQTPLPFFTQQELLSIFGSHDRDNLLIFERHTKLLLEYYLVQKDLNIEQPLSEYEVDTQNEYFIHLKDIFDVVLDSSNYELDKKARNSEKRIPDPKLWGWRIDNIL